ncbi:hypothetical protein BWQ96_04737 [Gracilariopsis chorda]|uniref:Uncharacterized protein n=1 Tax=Gracilariopsis chorda TaxID=448386 RepID=A0A2V3ITT7_9FLOR|nr:hypothetical protein BWQ96_04737 [Gracilariopsis chorda]|eukprot:PXF45535.1 hypothetical protein BWQ96_04737 [Gracilariopsis chorda]
MAASIALQLKIHNRMCLSSSEINEKLGKLMEQAALLGGFKTECVGTDDVGRVGNTPNSTNTLIGNTSSYQLTAENEANIQVQDTSILPTTSGLSSSITNIGDADANENQNASSGALR